MKRGSIAGNLAIVVVGLAIAIGGNVAWQYIKARIFWAAQERR